MGHTRERSLSATARSVQHFCLPGLRNFPLTSLGVPRLIAKKRGNTHTFNIFGWTLIEKWVLESGRSDISLSSNGVVYVQLTWVRF